MLRENGEEEGVDEIGCLWIRDCCHCKNLFEAISSGVCEVTDHRVIKSGDGEFARDCSYYENKWGYREEDYG